MKLRKNNLFLIGLLVFSLFATSLSLVPIENSTETKVEYVAEENKAEKKCDDFILTSEITKKVLSNPLNRALYKIPIYTYSYIKPFNKPPIS